MRVASIYYTCTVIPHEEEMLQGFRTYIHNEADMDLVKSIARALRSSTEFEDVVLVEETEVETEVSF